MMKSRKYMAGLVFGAALMYIPTTAFILQSKSQENTPAVIRFVQPADQGKFSWNSLINYAIAVTDKEDGSSDYNEIPAGEVLLKVQYLADSSKLKNKLASLSRENREVPALTYLMQSNCFTCHAVKNKLIGPAFELISKRYPHTELSAGQLVQKVIHGSTGVWGSTPMPPHPDISPEQLKEIVLWILTRSADPDICYYPGLEGAFRTREYPGKSGNKGVYLLTASYTDKGLKNTPHSSKRVSKTILLKPAGLP